MSHMRYKLLPSILGALLASATVHAAPLAQQGLEPVGAADGTWPTYHSTGGGFSVLFPPDWSVQEAADSTGATTVDLTSGDGVSAIGVRAGVSEGAALDLPNTLCSPVTVGRLSGSRCIDTLARSLIVTLNSAGSVYQLLTARRHDPAVFERVLASFVTDADGDTPPDVPSVLPPTDSQTPGDRCTSFTPRSRAEPQCPVP
ncbi:MAG: hypothetical protein LC797_07720 [Chloroflexi bacterium]|nr:hypothetical protein [Chloroflexota bacterium]